MIVNASSHGKPIIIAFSFFGAIACMREGADDLSLSGKTSAATAVWS